MWAYYKYLFNELILKQGIREDVIQVVSGQAVKDLTW